jgi:hypothetical protein
MVSKCEFLNSNSSTVKIYYIYEIYIYIYHIHSSNSISLGNVLYITHKDVLYFEKRDLLTQTWAHSKEV